MSAHSVAELTASTFVLNGERRPYHTQTVAQLLQTLALADKRVAVEVNAANRKDDFNAIIWRQRV
jgi:hypothetical protein